MKNVIISGASGNIAAHVIDILVDKDDINLILFLRNKSRLGNKDVSNNRENFFSELQPDVKGS